MENVWAAPTADIPVRATVTVPGSKSITNRALVLAAASEGPVDIYQPLRSRDTDLMVSALRALGTEIAETPTGWRVRPQPWQQSADIDCGLAGTIMRFLPPLAVLATGQITVDGDERARKRPQAQLLDALRNLGADIVGDRLPFTINATGGIEGGAVEIDASASSQFVSGLLLAGARYRNGLTVTHVGGRLPSLPHIEMTISMLRAVGVTIIAEANSWHVEAGRIQLPEWHVEPDLSNAAPFLAAAAITGGAVTITGWPTTTDQPGNALPELFEKFGATITRDAHGLTVHGTGKLTGIDADLSAVGELTPVLAAVAALADSPSEFTGIGHLRGHETDRLAALRTELNRLGSHVTETDDGLIIEPRSLQPGVFHTYHDHRMAQAGAVIGLVTPGIGVEDIATTAKTMPDFPQRWMSMLGAEH